MRFRVLLVAVVLVSTVATGGWAALDSQPADMSDVAVPPAETLVSPDGANSSVWPYTSRSRSAEDRTLALNVIVYGSPDRVRRALVARTEANWTVINETAMNGTAANGTAANETSTNETTANETAANSSAANWTRNVINGSIDVSPWRQAHGSTRYTYVTPDPNQTGQWVPATYQLHVGTYFGSRTHIRAYPSPSGNWTALQAHTEYWDWFRIRHTVTGVQPGAEFVERDLRDEPFVRSVTREYHGNRGGGSGGWWTIIDLATLLVAASTTGLTDRFARRDVALGAGVAALVLGVRAWGLAAEALFAGVTPKLFVALGYPVLAFGPLLLAVRLSRGRPARRAAMFAMAGLATGIVVDFALLGVQQLPTRLVGHRIALVAALGLVSLGSARENRNVVAAGVVLWVGLLLAALLGLL